MTEPERMTREELNVSTRRELPLAEEHRDAGAVMAEVDGWSVPRHYGDPRREYDRACTGVAVHDRSFRGRLLLTGRAPVQMMQGVLTNSVPSPAAGAGGVLRSRAHYSAILTAKGRMITDLRVLRIGAGDAEDLLLDLPTSGLVETVDYFSKVLPPRFAHVADVTEETGMLSLLGPEAGAVATELVRSVGGSDLVELSGDGDCQVIGLAGEEVTPLIVIRSEDLETPTFDFIAPIPVIKRLWFGAIESGCDPVGRGVWETLRVEAGTPAYGSDMDNRTIPVEAGIEDRAIDQTKGCYTGQEVIVRIRDRGHVNRHLRRLFFGDSPPPAPGTELFEPESGKVVGVVTSTAQSPAFGEGIGLGYVRREVEPPAIVRVAGVDGPEVRVVVLTG